MAWIAALIAIAAVVWLARSFRWMRYVLLASLVFIGIVVTYFLYDQAASKRTYEASKRRMPIGEVVFESLELNPQYSRGSYQLVGRVKNESHVETLLGAQVQLTMTDCVLEKCETVGEASEDIYLNVPPLQTRGVDEFVSFSNMPPARGTYRWTYRIVWVRSEARKGEDN